MTVSRVDRETRSTAPETGALPQAHLFHVLVITRKLAKSESGADLLEDGERFSLSMNPSWSAAFMPLRRRHANQH